MQQIQATSGAFAAILEDGSVATWGSQYHRSEILVEKRAVQDQRRGPRGQPRGFFNPQVIGPLLGLWKMDSS